MTAITNIAATAVYMRAEGGIYRELLERCAKAMGNGAKWSDAHGGMYILGDYSPTMWNPLTNLADAADMAIKMKVDVIWYVTSGAVEAREQKRGGVEAYTALEDHPTEQAAYCYAICRVVAQMGGE